MTRTGTAPKALLMGMLLSAAATAWAQDAAAPASDWTITGNAGLFSDYRFRGISQTDKKPAFQGGFDIAHSSGFYLGNWNSNIDSGLYQGANLEMDFYGGYKAAAGPVAYDLGVIHYYYPNSDKDGAPRIKNTEVYVGLGYSTLSAKLYYPISDFFSAEDIVDDGEAGGSYYVDLSGTYDLGSGFGLVGHVGYQKLKGSAKLTESDGDRKSNYVDWKLGATYTFANGFVLGLSYIDTNIDVKSGDRDITDSTALLSLSKTF